MSRHSRPDPFQLLLGGVQNHRPDFDGFDLSHTNALELLLLYTVELGVVRDTEQTILEEQVIVVVRVVVLVILRIVVVHRASLHRPDHCCKTEYCTWSGPW